MKKTFILALAIFAIVSCQKEISGNLSNEKEVVINFVTSSSTKTELSGDNIIWSEGDKLNVIQQVIGGDNAGITSRNSSSGKTTDSGVTMTFPYSTGEIKDATKFIYNAVYPADAVENALDLSAVTIITKSTQTPTANSYDKSADLLIAMPTDTTSQPTTIEGVRFKRMVAIGQMTITNLGSSEPITNITFSAKKSSKDVILAGTTAYNLTKGVISSSYGSESAEKEIVLDYAGLDIEASTSMTAYFTCYPFELSENDKFTVVVETATKTFSRTVTLGSNRSLTMTAGNGAKFTVDMSETEEDTEIIKDCLDLNFTGVSGTSYATWNDRKSISKALYTGCSAGSNSSIQLNESSSSGIISTTSAGIPEKVVVNWNSSTFDGRTLNVYGANTEYESVSDLYNNNKQGTLLGSIKKGESILLELTDSYKYIGLRPSGTGAMYLTSITISRRVPCADPVITLNGNVATISCATQGSSVKYEYGENPSDPDENSSSYSSPVELTYGHTIKAIAIKDGYSSSIVSKKYPQTIEINTANSGVTGTYASTTFDVDEITFGYTDWSKSTNIQAKKSTVNSCYNVDSIPNSIKKITIVQTGTARAVTMYGGTLSKPTTPITSPDEALTMEFDFTGGNYTYFSMTTPGYAVHIDKITIEY